MVNKQLRIHVSGGQVDSLRSIPKLDQFREEVISDEGGLKDILEGTYAKSRGWTIEERSRWVDNYWGGPNALVGFGDQSNSQYPLPELGSWLPGGGRSLGAPFPMSRYP